MAAYRKLRADKLFTGTAMLGDDKVLIIHTEGTVESIANMQDAGDDIEFLPGMLSPGFINAHCHLDLSHLKNKIPVGTGLVEFVQQVMAKRNECSLDEKLEAMQSAAAEMYASGIVAVGDICNSNESIPVKINNPIVWKNFAEISGFVDAIAAQRLEPVIETAESFRQAGMHAQVVPHSPYSVSKTLFRLINEQSTGQLISIHNQEAEAENELYQNKTGSLLKLYKNLGINISAFEATGKSSLLSWLPYFNKQQSIIAVHNCFSRQGDIVFAKNYALNNLSEMYYCVCINANQYIDNTFPPLEMLQQQETNIVIGTDSYASNWQLNVWEEIKTIRKHFPAIELEKILGWATINGAKALGLQAKLGSFEKGKSPGIVHVHEEEAQRIL